MKKNIYKNIAIAAIISLVGALCFSPIKTAIAAEGDAMWARSVATAPNQSTFNGVANDSSGNVYAAGYINGTGEFNFGNGVTVSGAYASGDNALLVKYNSSGTAQWAKSLTAAPNASSFRKVAVDSSGNIYAAGTITENGTFDFGNGVTVSGAYANSNNILLVKYNSSGTAQWAKSTVTGSDSSLFYNLEVDNNGNVYAVGQMDFDEEFGFGDGVAITGTSTSANPMLVKYNSSGTALWAKTIVSGSGHTAYMGVALDSSANIIVAGSTYNNSERGFGNSVTVSGACANNYNTLLVKYNSSGTAQWARSNEIGSNYSQYTDLSIDSSGNIYASGMVRGSGEFGFGNSVTVSGAFAVNYNALFVKYNSSGTAQWARSTETGPNTSMFIEVVADSSGNTIVVGRITNDDLYGFGNGVTVSGAYAGGENVVLVKYNSSGTAQWAKTAVEGNGPSSYMSMAVDSSGNVFSAGYANGNGQFDFGDGATVDTINANANALLVKYDSALLDSGPGDPDPGGDPDPSEDTTPPVFTDFPGGEGGINITEGQTITTNPFIIKVKPTDNVEIQKVEFYVDYNLLCTETNAVDGIYSCSWDTSKYHSIVKVIAYDTSGNTTEIIRSATVDPSLYTTTTIPAMTELPKTGI